MFSGREKLKYETEKITVVLESDGTEVDDEEYFSFLAEQTTFIFLTKHDEWIPACGKYLTKMHAKLVLFDIALMTNYLYYIHVSSNVGFSWFNWFIFPYVVKIQMSP